MTQGVGTGLPKEPEPTEGRTQPGDAAVIHVLVTCLEEILGGDRPLRQQPPEGHPHPASTATGTHEVTDIEPVLGELVVDQFKGHMRFRKLLAFVVVATPCVLCSAAETDLIFRGASAASLAEAIVPLSPLALAAMYFYFPRRWRSPK